MSLAMPPFADHMLWRNDPVVAVTGVPGWTRL